MVPAGGGSGCPGAQQGGPGGCTKVGDVRRERGRKARGRAGAAAPAAALWPCQQRHLSSSTQQRRPPRSVRRAGVRRGAGRCRAGVARLWRHRSHQPLRWMASRTSVQTPSAMKSPWQHPATVLKRIPEQMHSRAWTAAAVGAIAGPERFQVPELCYVHQHTSSHTKVIVSPQCR